MKKKTKKILKAVGTAGIAATATYFLLGNIFYFSTLTKSGLNGSITKKVVKSNKGKDEYTLYLNSELDKGKLWFDDAKKEKIAIRASSDKKNLHADFIFADEPTDICALVVHGYTSSPRNMGVYAKKYHELGYDVLMPSLNGHADSEAGYVTMGWEDRLDVIDWINFLIETKPNIKIIIHGVSMGAATTMMATGEELPDNVKVAIADCGFTSVWDIFSNKITNSLKMHEFPMLYSASTVNKLYSGFDFKEASSVEQLKKSKTPTIFLHGENDKFVPYEMLDKVYEAASCEKEKVTIPNAPHARNACANPELYWNSVLNFINKYI